MRPEPLRRLRHKFGALHRSRVDRYLIGPGQQQFADIINDTHPTAHGQGHEGNLCRAGNHIIDGFAIVRTGGDIQKGQFIRAGRIINPGLFHRIARITQTDEIHTLDHATVFHVQTGNYAGGQHRA